MNYTGKFDVLKSKKFIVLYVMIAVMIVIACAVYATQVTGTYLSFDPTTEGLDTALQTYYWFLAVLVIAGCAAAYYFSFIRKVKLHYIVMIMILVLGMTSMFVMTPNAVADEITHYESSYRVSNDLFGEEHANEAGEVPMASDNYSVLEDYPNIVNAENYAKVLENFVQDEENPQSYYITGKDASAIASIGYSASALGIAFARGLGLSPLMLYYTGRVFNLLAFAFLVTLAVRKIPFGKVTLSAIALLPMVMQQAGSYSYDAIINGLAMFFIAYCLYIAYSDKKPTWWEWGIMICAAVLIVPMKFVYAPILGLFFLIPTSRFGSLKVKLIVYGVIIAGVAVFMLKFVSGALAGGTYLEYADAYAYSSSYIMEHPANTLNVFVETFHNNFIYYLSSAFSGYLGWLNVYVPDSFAIMFLVIIIASLVFNHRDTLNERKYKITNRIWMFAVAFVVIVLVYLSMFISWTPQGSATIAGIQGRYFLPVIPLCFLAFYQKRGTISFKKDYSVRLLYIEMLLSVFVFLIAFLYAV